MSAVRPAVRARAAHRFASYTHTAATATLCAAYAAPAAAHTHALPHCRATACARCLPAAAFSYAAVHATFHASTRIACLTHTLPLRALPRYAFARLPFRTPRTFRLRHLFCPSRIHCAHRVGWYAMMIKHLAPCLSMTQLLCT